MGKAKQESLGEEESRQRFEAALRGAFATPPKPMKDIPRKRFESKTEAKG
jgi:hypothetical protein